MNDKKNEAYYALEDDSDQIVTWSKKYATGIELIDNQHKKLVYLTNELYRACLSGNDEEVFKGAMKSMVEYVRFHFTAEQKLLEHIHYPGCVTHKMQHETLVKNILDTVKDYREGRPFVPNNFVRTLKDWVFGHIAVHDKVYAAYYADKIKNAAVLEEVAG